MGAALGTGDHASPHRAKKAQRACRLPLPCRWHGLADRARLHTQSVGVGEARYLTIGTAPHEGGGEASSGAPAGRVRLTSEQVALARFIYDAAMMVRRCRAAVFFKGVPIVRHASTVWAALHSEGSSRAARGSTGRCSRGPDAPSCTSAGQLSSVTRLCVQEGGTHWERSRGEIEALVASGQPLPADLQAIVDKRWVGRREGSCRRAVLSALLLPAPRWTL